MAIRKGKAFVNVEIPDEASKRIEARIAGRKMAADVFLLLSWEDGHGVEYADALCETLRDLLPKRRVEPEPKQPIARLGATVMPFGSHKGKTFDEVEIEYLDWLCKSQEEFYKNLRAYLKHDDLESHRGNAK